MDKMRNEMYAEIDRLRAERDALMKAGERCIAALRANDAPNCEAVKEMRAALAKVTP